MPRPGGHGPGFDGPRHGHFGPPPGHHGPRHGFGGFHIHHAPPPPPRYGGYYRGGCLGCAFYLFIAIALFTTLAIILF